MQIKKIGICLVFIFVASNAVAQIQDFKAIDFTKASQVALRHKGASLYHLPILAHKLTHTLDTDVEKFKAIYLWVCQNISSDMALHQKITRKHSLFKKDSLGFTRWNTTYKKTFFKKLLTQKKTICTGYAYLVKELANLANIRCEIINGYARTAQDNTHALTEPNHSWNAVFLNQKWYLCDPTWSSGYQDQTNTFIFKKNEGYFLSDPVWFGKNHFPIQQKWNLSKNTRHNFTSGPLIYHDAFLEGVFAVSPKKMQHTIQKKSALSFVVETKEKINPSDICLIYYNSALEEKKIPLQKYISQKNTINITAFFKHKGYYDVHIKVKNQIIATYIIKVVRAVKKM